MADCRPRQGKQGYSKVVDQWGVADEGKAALQHVECSSSLDTWHPWPLLLSLACPCTAMQISTLSQ
jgi:hypothetical protein